MATQQTAAFDGDVRLDHLKALDIKGENAEKFLQGQTSAQMRLANGTFAPLACFCTPKGRIIANGQFYRVAEHYYRLILSTSLAEKLAEHLKKFAVFYRAELDVNADVTLLGSGAEQARERASQLGFALPTSGYLQAGDEKNSVLRLPGQERYLFCLQEDVPGADLALQNAWRLADIRDGIAWLDASQEDHFLPQMINWEALGGVSFKKGCYTGQEVVARAHFRGQVKKRLVRVSVDTDALPAPTEALTDDAGKSLGEVVISASTEDGGCELLAVVATRVIEGAAKLYLGDKPVTLEPLPYPVERLDPEQLSVSLSA